MSFERALPLIGADGLARLAESRVAVVGVGGVGGHVAEQLARCGVGEIVLIDGDVVEKSNLNRQIVALTSTLGLNKAEIMRDRIEDINPDCRAEAYPVMLDGSNCARLLDGVDYVADAIDQLSAKADLAQFCAERGLPIVCAMGAGNRAGYCEFSVTDIYKTQYDPLAKKFRRMMKERGVKKLDVCYTPVPPSYTGSGVASVSYTPAACGIRMAAYIAERLLAKRSC